jgi:hypothetical protein
MILAAQLYAFWVLYLAVMALYRAHLNKTLTKLGYALGLPLVAFGLVIDFIMNVTVFAVLFLELPREWLVTDRLQRHMRRSGWRFKLAKFICEGLLNFADPSGNHCD